MKNILNKVKVLIAALIFGVTITSCDSFFKEPIGENMNQYVVFETMYKAERALYPAYNMLMYYWPESMLNNHGNRMFGDITASICDEAVCGSVYGGASTNHYAEGTLSPTNLDKAEFNFYEPWGQIRSAYVFLEGIELMSSAEKKKPEYPAWKARTTAEAKVLIANSYYEMIRRYGSVPWVDRVYYNSTDADLVRLPLAELVEKVDKLITESVNALPDRIEQADPNYGRLTKGAALFLRARLWLTLASPLFNTSSTYVPYDHPELVCMMTGNPKALWEKAAACTKEAIDFLEGHGYKLVDTGHPQSDYTVATRDLENNTELVLFTRRFAQSIGSDEKNCTQIVAAHAPPSFHRPSGEGGGWTSITQNLVDQYLVKVDESTSRRQTAQDYQTACPWEEMELDPRFYSTVIYDGCEFGTEDEQVAIYTQDGDKYISTHRGHGFVTGYYLKKFQYGNIFLDPKAREDCPYPCMRLPEMYLNYAEILNEINPGSPEIATYLNKTVKRVDMPEISLNGMDQNAVREEIRRERAVELAIEDQRYFDVKRWMIADKTIGATKFAVVRDGAADAPDRTYHIAPVQDSKQTIWSNKKYLMPFPHNEILKDRGLIQNPGW